MVCGVMLHGLLLISCVAAFAFAAPYMVAGEPVPSSAVLVLFAAGMPLLCAWHWQELENYCCELRAQALAVRPDGKGESVRVHASQSSGSIDDFDIN
jgi:hypothetical protein